MKRIPQFTTILLLAAVFHTLIAGNSFGKPLPFVKQWHSQGGELRLTGASISTNTVDLKGEADILKHILKENEIPVGNGLIPIRLEIAPVTFPAMDSSYQDSITDQGYQLTVNEKGILIKALSAAGVFYGTQTLAQMIGPKAQVPLVEILDWPDLSVRMIMVDPARQMENMDYYKRVIRFCARYKINILHMHLTDDQFSALYQEDYPWLMHPRALRPEQVQELVTLAKRYHIEIIPEIESPGHSAMFVRTPFLEEILHQTPRDQKSERETHPLTGFANVLCPASPLTYEYLDRMYDQTAQNFPYPLLHIGCDEVKITSCKRCESKFGKLDTEDSKNAWFLEHIEKCQELAKKYGYKTAIWGDMLLHHREVADKLDKTTVIFDWQYDGDVSSETSEFFKKKGFDVIACPALVCCWYMPRPGVRRYDNIRNFAAIARKNDLQGINTTIWLPMRYMSDFLWTGISFAAVQSWAGSNWDETAFYSDFMKDFFDSQEGPAFEKAWKGLYEIDWELDEIWTSFWVDTKSFEKAQRMAKQQGKKLRGERKKLDEVLRKLKEIRSTIKKNQTEWKTIEQTAEIFSYMMDHLLDSADIYSDGKWNKRRIKELDERCLQAIDWIEKDWDRNRYPDDLGKDGIFLHSAHLLYRLKSGHRFHQEILQGEN